MAISIETMKGINSTIVFTDRVKKRHLECEGAPLWISGRRGRSFTESWKTSEAEPLNVRWALAIARVLDESSIVIRDGELIVGSETKYVRGAEVVPEQNPHDILKSLEQKQVRTMSEVMSASIEPEEEVAMREAAQYWMGKSIRDRVETSRMRQNGKQYLDLIDNGVRVMTDSVGAVGKNQGNFNPRIIREGLQPTIDRAKQEKAKVMQSWCTFPRDSFARYHKIAVLDSIIIVCEAIIRFARRHAELARQMAETEKDQVRKQELLEIAERCEWVPANPARTFAEALQSFWFCSLGQKKESPFPSGSCPGRMDEWLYPLFKKDIESGKLNYQQAAETLGCMWVKFNEAQSFHGFYFAKEAAGSLLQQITIGGTDKDGKDATNDVSYLILEVSRQMAIPQPGLYVRWHNTIDHNFMIKAVETNRDTGGGVPAFINDQAGTRNFLGLGVPLEDAGEWTAAGCLSYCLSKVNTVVRMPLYINIPKVFEIALNNGYDPRTGIKAGRQTGEAVKFTSIDQLENAFWEQFSYFIDKGLNDLYIGFLAKGDFLCAPVSTAYLEDSIKTGKDAMEEGGRYPQLNLCIGQRGFVDVANSLAAIRKVVFEDKKVTMSRLLEALKADWVGYDDVLKLCMQAPKYGNDDDYVDEIHDRLSLKSGEIIAAKKDPVNGLTWKVARPALTGHYYLGEVVGALPNGRQAGTPLYDAALSPGAGTDVNGPTSAIKSATKVNHFKPDMDSLVMNMKFSSTILKDRSSIEQFISMMRTFFNRGGWHIQFNILNKDDLIQAKAHPEQWKHLIVRVAGYSAYFVELPPAIQDEIIARTEHSL
ncbi:MAG: pyruvate formate lyase family protein [Dehalococcoidales bacterium]|nr:pyruvate formate lyase family protein [Dehalococcoidales bacterium]